jgi:hypothetical protein
LKCVNFLFSLSSQIESKMIAKNGDLAHPFTTVSIVNFVSGNAGDWGLQLLPKRYMKTHLTISADANHFRQWGVIIVMSCSRPQSVTACIVSSCELRDTLSRNDTDLRLLLQNCQVPSESTSRWLAVDRSVTPLPTPPPPPPPPPPPQRRPMIVADRDWRRRAAARSSSAYGDRLFEQRHRAATAQQNGDRSGAAPVDCAAASSGASMKGFARRRSAKINTP